jgi:hypothetical protein
MADSNHINFTQIFPDQYSWPTLPQHSDKLIGGIPETGQTFDGSSGDSSVEIPDTVSDKIYRGSLTIGDQDDIVWSWKTFDVSSGYSSAEIPDIVSDKIYTEAHSQLRIRMISSKAVWSLLLPKNFPAGPPRSQGSWHQRIVLWDPHLQAILPH